MDSNLRCCAINENGRKRKRNDEEPMIVNENALEPTQSMSGENQKSETQQEFIYLSEAHTLQMDMCKLIANVLANAWLYKESEPFLETVTFLSVIDDLQQQRKIECEEIRCAGQFFRFRIIVTSRGRIGCLNESDTVLMKEIRDVVDAFKMSDHTALKGTKRLQQAEQLLDSFGSCEHYGDEPTVMLAKFTKAAEYLLEDFSICIRNELNLLNDFDPLEFNRQLRQDPVHNEFFAQISSETGSYLSVADKIQMDMIDLILMTKLHAAIFDEYKPLIHAVVCVDSLKHMETAEEILNAAKLLRFRIIVESRSNIGCLTESDSILMEKIREIVRVSDLDSTAFKNITPEFLGENVDHRQIFPFLYLILKGLLQSLPKDENNFVNVSFFSRYVYKESDNDPHDMLALDRKWKRRYLIEKARAVAAELTNGNKFESRFLNEYKPIKLLGQGGFGCVFEVEKRSIDMDQTKSYAAKRIAISNEKYALLSSMREFFAFLLLESNHIVQCFDTWMEEPPTGWQRCTDEHILNEIKFEERFEFNYRDDSSFFYIIMELCDSSLAEWLYKNKHREQRKMKMWFSQIVYAIEYLHEQDFIYRDLKPCNILLDGSDKLKICDFGLASQAIVRKEGKEVATELSSGVGTIDYMAPEQIGWEYSSKVDIFALGLIFAEMCVVMTDEKEKKKVFDNYRSGKPNDILRHWPEAEQFVSWLTNQIDTERPDAQTVASCSFLNTF